VYSLHIHVLTFFKYYFKITLLCAHKYSVLHQRLSNCILVCLLRSQFTTHYPKYSGLVPPFIQKLCKCEAPVDGRTTMSNKSVCQVARSLVEVGSFNKWLFGVVYVTCGDFHDGSEKGTASVHQILCKSWEKCYGDTHNDSISLQGQNLETYAGVSMAWPVQDRSKISWRLRTHRETQKLCNSWKFARIQELEILQSKKCNMKVHNIRWIDFPINKQIIQANNGERKH
jgi:hypothetical protein